MWKIPDFWIARATIIWMSNLKTLELIFQILCFCRWRSNFCFEYKGWAWQIQQLYKKDGGVKRFHISQQSKFMVSDGSGFLLITRWCIFDSEFIDSLYRKDKVISMKRVEYRCYRCMIVLSILISDFESSTEYIVCNECGGESKRIGIAPIASTHHFDHAEH